MALIGACWSEYPGIVFDVDAELPELYALASYYAAKGGMVWAAELDGRIEGMIAVSPAHSSTFEIGRLYLYPRWRGTGLAARLLDQAEGFARAQGAGRLTLWSDTRFVRAHRFYEKCSYVRSGPVRALYDLSNTLEYAYAKPLSSVGVERLDGAATGSAVRRLAELCQGSADGRLVGSDAAWHRIAAEVGQGQRILLAGWCDGVLSAAVTLDLATPADQPHRAMVEWLADGPDASRLVLARRLLAGLEEEARRSGRSLLTCAARADQALVALSRGLGWAEVGRIANARMSADGTLHDEVILCKHLARFSPRVG